MVFGHRLDLVSEVFCNLIDSVNTATTGTNRSGIELMRKETNTAGWEEPGEHLHFQFSYIMLTCHEPSCDLVKQNPSTVFQVNSKFVLDHDKQ